MIFTTGDTWNFAMDNSPPTELEVDVTDGNTVGIAFLDNERCWVFCYNPPMEVIWWRLRPLPPARNIRPSCVGYNPNSELGPLECVVLFHRQENGNFIPFHITEQAYVSLNGGKGIVYGRTPWGPVCKLKVYCYRVITYKIVDNVDELEEFFKKMEDD